MHEDLRPWLRELLGDAAACPRLSSWEETFVEDMQRRLDASQSSISVSDKQMNVLTRIEEKVYAVG